MGSTPDWIETTSPQTPEGVAALLRDLHRTETLIVLAERTGFTRFALARWFKGVGQPKLPQFLALIDALTGRLLDFIAAFVEPLQVPEIAVRWAELNAARRSAYETPWAHAVLRALELTTLASLAEPAEWIARHLGLSMEQVRDALRLLHDAGQVEIAHDNTYKVRQLLTVDTGSEGQRDPARSRALKSYWLDTARRRLESGAPGVFGYNLMSISRRDYGRLQDLHRSYFREMQALVAGSTPSEMVVLFGTQLLALGGVNDDR